MLLTPGQQEQIDAHHRRWADYRASKIEERNEIWMLYLHDPVFRELCNSRLREETAEADLFFINTFCTTFDPRRQDHGESAEVEFILDEEQEQFIYWHWHLENLVREGRGLIKITAHELKSRDRGGSWMTISLKVKRFLFRQNYISLVGHETEDDIDKPEAPKSIFWRVDFLIRMLPKEMIPDGYFRKDKPQEVSQKYHRHLGRNNPITGSVLTGDPVTDTWGGGDRTSDAWMDEAPECGGNNKDNARAGFAKVGFTTNFRLTTGTPPTEGMANWWSKLVNDPDPTKRQVPDPSVDMTKWWEKPEWQWKEGMARVFYLCWENDPRYNAHYIDGRGKKVYPWKESLPEHFSDQEIASEVQRDFKGSVTGIVYPQASRVRRMQFGYDPRLPLYLNMDPGLGDKFALLWRQYDFHSGRHRILQTYRNNNKKTKFYIPLILGEEFLSLADDEKLTEEDLEIISRVTGWRYAGFYGDSAGRNRQNNDGRSVYDELRIESTAIDPYRNINVRYTVFGNNEHYQRVDSVRKTLPLCDVNERWAPHFLPAIEACRWPNEGTNTTNAPRMPRHNTLDRDLVTAFEFGCVADIARLHSGDEKVFQPQTRSFTWGSRMAGAEEEEEQTQAGGIWVPQKVIDRERRQPLRIHRCRR